MRKGEIAGFTKRKGKERKNKDGQRRRGEEVNKRRQMMREKCEKHRGRTTKMDQH
jgi:hypothetical protein